MRINLTPKAQKELEKLCRDNISTSLRLYLTGAICIFFYTTKTVRI